MKYIFSTQLYDLEEINEMYKWCTENLYHSGHYEPHWDWDKDCFVFSDEKELVWFKLRWE